MTFTTSAQTRPLFVDIGGRRIGVGCPVYVIAEAGVNHDGLVEKALRLVDAATEARADAVKFQMFRAAELASRDAGVAEYQAPGGARSQYEMLRRLELTEAEFRRIREHCRDRGIEFLASPFGIRDAERLAKLGVNAFKLASTELNNLSLLRHVAQTGFPLILSTGASSAEEIRGGVERLEGMNAGDRLILLHCVSAYPTPMEAANLGAIATLRNTFGVVSGFSDHTTETRTGAWAAAAGACVLEKHFTLDRTTPGPDHAMSLTPADLRKYISNVREVERALGDGELDMNSIEADVRAVARKSVVAACDIAAGTVLTYSLLCLKRPGGGIEPDQFDAIVGRRTVVDAPRDTVLTWDMIR